MYHKQLEMFIKVAELGSFSKAAEALYITPSAVIQQMNHLEQEMGTKLLHRSKQGTSLTDTGKILFQGGQEMIRLSQETRKQIRLVEERSTKEMVVGTSFLHKSRLIYELWIRFIKKESNYRIQIEDISHKWEKYETVDLVEALLDGEPWQDGHNFMEVCKIPIACAVPKNHPLATKKFISFEDMKGQTLITITPGMSEELDRLAKECEERGMLVHYVDKYDMSTFSTCIINGYLLQAPACWQDIYPDMVCIPCEWDYALPYGFFFKQESSRLVQKFLKFVQEICQKETFRLY